MPDESFCFPLILTYLSDVTWAGPFPPAAGQPGSDAIPYTSPSIVEWASGYQNYIEGSPINQSFANPTTTLGPAQGTTTGITELGDGGQITLTFPHPIKSSGGADFAVFGNAFESGYNKLAYVYVSANGVNWFEMPNVSLTPGPISTFGTNMDPTNISGLAGKYVVGDGVPFSLSSVGLPYAEYVKIVDIIGNGSQKDSLGNPIYDPTPNSNGFNVGGVGVLSVPEPSSLVLLSLGMLLVVWRQHRQRRGC